MAKAFCSKSNDSETFEIYPLRYWIRPSFSLAFPDVPSRPRPAAPASDAIRSQQAWSSLRRVWLNSTRLSSSSSSRHQHETRAARGDTLRCGWKCDMTCTTRQLWTRSRSFHCRNRCRGLWWWMALRDEPLANWPPYLEKNCCYLEGTISVWCTLLAYGPFTVSVTFGLVFCQISCEFNNLKICNSSEWRLLFLDRYPRRDCAPPFILLIVLDPDSCNGGQQLCILRGRFPRFLCHLYCNWLSSLERIRPLLRLFCR